ncbi:MAG: GMC family oxidoreductase [Candidatus Babeliales bacterium]
MKLFCPRSFMLVSCIFFHCAAQTSHEKAINQGIFEYTADYIIVGAGAAGSVIAARLAHAGYSVIVIEAGPNTGKDSFDPLVQFDKGLIQTPIYYSFLFNRFNQNPFSVQCGQWNATQTLADFVSIDQNGIYYAYPRGVGAGGCTSHHNMQDGVGSLQVYDNIAIVVGDDYWNGSNIKRLFKKMENVLYAKPGDACAGTNGWLSVQHTTVEPLLQSISDVVVDTIKIPYRENFCNPFDVAGVGNADVQIGKDGNKSYAYQDLLLPTQQKTGLIKVEFNTLAAEILLKKNEDVTAKNQYNAYGVKAYNKAYLQEVQPGGAHEFTCSVPNNCPDPKVCVARRVDNSLPQMANHYLARKEVIICCGAIQSPQLLMLSGIGPKEHLEQIGIDTKIDLPGVGSDLLDHCEVSIIYEINPKVFIPTWQAHLLLEQHGSKLPSDIYARALQAAAAFPEYANQNTGAIQWDWYSKGKAPLMQEGAYPFPDIHAVPYQSFYFNFDLTLISPLYPDNYFNFSRNQLVPDYNKPLNQQGMAQKGTLNSAQFAANPRVYLTWLIENLIPGNSKGTIRLASNDPRKSPIIREQLYEDDQGIENMARMILQVRDVMNEPRIKNTYSIPDKPWEIIPGPRAATLQDLKTYIKNWSSFGHHMSGTCQMGAVDATTGKAKNKNTVLDSRCRVLGVDNLRVADTSVYVTPWLHAFNTSRAAYVVGEAVSEFIVNPRV